MRLMLTALAALALCPANALAQDNVEQAAPVEDTGDRILRAINGELPYESVFSEGFRNQVPEAQFLAIKAQLESQLGTLIGIESVETTSQTTGRIMLRFENALAGGPFSLDAEPPFLVNGFLLNDIQPIDDSAEGLISDLEALPGETNMLVMRIGADEPLLAHNAASQMALGSTFKLYVLSALAHAIAEGQYSWDDVVPLTESSFPSGMLQDWPEGAPVTLHTLATLMISISDNTATDQLIAVLGRDAIEAELVAAGHSDPAATIPFMTTRELFLLKTRDPGEIEEYRALDPDGRLEALGSLAAQDVSDADVMAAFTNGPNAIDLEWFASGHDIARLFTRLRDLGDERALGVMGVNPSMSEGDAADWSYIGFKGGSEPGVLNLSWLLQSPDGEWTVVTMGWSNPDAEVEATQFELLSRRAISLAAGD